jgi:hypothetical protein
MLIKASAGLLRPEGLRENRITMLWTIAVILLILFNFVAFRFFISCRWRFDPHYLGDRRNRGSDSTCDGPSSLTDFL